MMQCCDLVGVRFAIPVDHWGLCGLSLLTIFLMVALDFVVSALAGEGLLLALLSLSRVS